MFPVAACIAERVGGAAALFKVIVSSFPDFLSVTLSSFLSSVILHIHFVFSFKPSPFFPIFCSVDPIIVVLNLSFDWVIFFFFFKGLFEEIVDVIFPSFSWSTDRSVGPLS